MNKIKAIIFDMDGVLVDSESVVRECMRKSAEMFSLPYEDKFYELFLGCNDEMSTRILAERYHDEEIAVRMMEDIAIRSSKEYEDGNIRLKPGCREVIAYLQKIGMPYALATGSSYPYVEMNFLRNGYDQVPFDFIVTGDKISKSKPDPEIFLKAAELMDQDIRDCLIVEDSPKGLEAASRSEGKVCFVPDLVEANQELLDKSDYYQNDLFGVIELIKELGS